MLSPTRDSNLLVLRTIFFPFLILLSYTSFGQQSSLIEENKSKKELSLKFEGDSRRTIVNRESVSIYGVRLGALIQERTSVGIGIYSSNLFGIVGRTVNKMYQDTEVNPPAFFDSNIGFHYFSTYGEYTLINNNRLKFTANSQLGFGWVDIDFVEPNLEKDRIRESKSLIEHSIKLDVKTFEWLRINGGVGYRYLIAGEQQIKNAFNSPIYIIGFSIDYKYLSNKIFKKKI